MKFTNTNVGESPAILKRKLGAEYLVPITIASTAFASVDVIKAGTPIDADGTVSNDGDAIGILLNDVYKDNPNGSLIKGFAVINKANAEKNASITISTSVISKLTNIIFE